ncbi:hypothetical protein J3D56_004225 [Erwinia persicina]|uniref:hypothetical protein n=1 Tax=Erwinia persicina TaxID=55211 RepID=UPI00209D89C5|nr:hypothetical protein [Erwinia persicina]MCP1440789.1 hypothetical protein [Erwinia persicina]
MKSVKRYDGKIEHCDNGGYVTFADYKKLEARLENAEGRERKHCKRADTAEAELARRDAQEPCPRCGVRSSRPNGEHYCHKQAEPRPAAPQEWTDKQCLEFISIAFRHAEISGDIQMDDIRLGIKMVNAGGETAE